MRRRAAWALLAWCFVGQVGAQAAAPQARAPGPGDAARGRQLYESRCIGCHSVDEHRIGPHHLKLIGRQAGAAAGYAYSPALASAGFRWTPDLLDRWLASPAALVPGQRMPVSVDAAADRRDLIEWLTLQ